MLYNNRLNHIMPPQTIAPALPTNPSSILCDNNSLPFVHQVKNKNNAFAADRGENFSVSSQLNADSGSTGTFIAVKDTGQITDLKMCTPASRIGVMVANGHTIFSTHTGSLTLPSGHSLQAYIFRISRRLCYLLATWQT